MCHLATILCAYVYMHNFNPCAYVEVICGYLLPLSHRVNCVLTQRYISLLSHAYMEWYNDILLYLTCFLNYPSLNMWVVLSMIYIASLMSINTTRERTCSPVSTWNANVVTFVPADVLKRKYDLRWGIGSHSDDPEYRLTYTNNIYMNIVLNMALTFKQHSLKWGMRSRTGRVYSAFEGVWELFIVVRTVILFYLHWWWIWHYNMVRWIFATDAMHFRPRYGTFWPCGLFTLLYFCKHRLSKISMKPRWEVRLWGYFQGMFCKFNHHIEINDSFLNTTTYQ